MSPETGQNSETNKPSVIKIASPVLKDLAFHRACSYELNNKDQLVGTNSNQVCSWQHPRVLSVLTCQDGSVMKLNVRGWERKAQRLIATGPQTLNTPP